LDTEVDIVENPIGVPRPVSIKQEKICGVYVDSEAVEKVGQGVEAEDGAGEQMLR
jgi:hypothetical protein